MSLSSVITLALVLKKISRKGTIAKKAFRPKRNTKAAAASPTATVSPAEQDDDQQDEKIVYNVLDEKQAPAEQDQCSSFVSSEQTSHSGEQESQPVIIRDFAYPESSPLFHGQPEEPKRRASQVSLSSSEFTGRHARALYDFSPETEYEVSMKAGDIVWVQYRQCPGWLIADVQDETGLIPESYVEFV
ncbi:hypothetical protein VTP01DRAFT_7061 [Rhizomucor pusillus]|uniref:uncharacterized protein n=1 Tax=Rhizomucor pusillus TaxID=4840 RepID=UPI00374457D7